MTPHVTDVNQANRQEVNDVAQAALIVIDMQNDFCAKGGYFDRTGANLSDMEPLADRISACIGAAREAGVMIIFVRSAYDSIYLSQTQINRRRRVGWEMPLCRSGTWGYEFFGVAPLPGEPIVTKHRFDAFHNTDLELLLRSNGKRRLYFAGVATDVCVESALRSAFMRDFEVILLADCAAARNPQAHQATLETVQYHFGLVATSRDFQSLCNKQDATSR